MEAKQLEINLNSYKQAKYLNDCILFGNRQGITNYTVKIGNGLALPEACTPIAGILDYYRQRGVSFEIIKDDKSYASHTQVEYPLIAEEAENKPKMLYPFDRVWRFSTPDGVFQLVTSYISAMRQADIFEDGVLVSIEWCINEVMDNVLQHSGCECGFVMIQLIKQYKLINICVFDSGIGIYNSLKVSKHHPTKALDAITLALQERVTRDEKVGQGNGLWGLSKIIEATSGSVQVLSSGASYQYTNGQTTTRETGMFNLGQANGATLIIFQLNYSRKIDISSVLSGYKLIDLWVEEHENLAGEMEVLISQEAHGTGTRKSAERLRNQVLNALKAEKRRVILDFTGVNLISSSFADELVGKIIADYGLLFFNQIFSLKNLSKLNITVLNRSVEQRMAQVYYDHLIEDPQDEV